MTNNKPKIKRDSVVPAVDVERVARAQKRLISLYSRLGNWRAVGLHCGVAHRYAWDLAMNGVVPSNPDIRKALFLPKVMPSERVIKRTIKLISKLRVPKFKVWECPDLYLKG